MSSEMRSASGFGLSISWVRAVGVRSLVRAHADGARLSQRSRFDDLRRVVAGCGPALVKVQHVDREVAHAGHEIFIASLGPLAGGELGLLEALRVEAGVGSHPVPTYSSGHWPIPRRSRTTLSVSEPVTKSAHAVIRGLRRSSMLDRYPICFHHHRRTAPVSRRAQLERQRDPGEAVENQ